MFATDEELGEFPESKTDSSTIQDKTPSPKDINLMASDLPRSHTDLPKISSRLPDCKSKRKSRRNCRHKSQSKNSIVGCLAVQANDHIDTKQEKQWVIQPTHATYLDQLVGHPLGPPPPEAAFPVVHQPLLGQPIVGPPKTAPPMVSQPGCPVPPLLSLCLQPKLECAHLNPLTPGTPVCPPWYPDWPEPIKLSYKKL